MLGRFTGKTSFFRHGKSFVTRRGASRAAMTLIIAALPGAVFAQAQTPTPQAPLPQNPPAKTPPTPLPKSIPVTDAYGIKPKDVKPTGTFDKIAPGQPLPGDPTSIRTLEDALGAAFMRTPSLLLAEERAYRTTRTVRQILATNGPQVSVTGNYSHLSGAGAGSVNGGISPGQVQNPFGVGLSTTPPGSAPITLSSATASTAGSGTTATAATGSTSTNAATSSSTTTRAAATPEGSGSTASPGSGITRQVGQGGGGSSQATNLNPYSFRATVSQLIDITGIVRTAVEVGRLEEATTRLEIIRTKMDVALNVKNSYYNLLRAQELVRVNEAAVAQSEELLRVTRVQREQGVVADYDVLRAQTQLANNQQALISSRNQVIIAKNALANLIGIDPATPVDPQAPPIPPLPTLEDEPLIGTAFRQRPEYAQADINILKATKNERLARRTLEPYLNAAASAAYTPTTTFGDKSNGSVGLILTVPLTDGGSTRAAIEAARSDERGALVQKDQFVRGIKAEVQQSIVAVRDANERAQSAAQSVTQAREAFRLANVRYKAGVGTQLDVNDAQTALTQAETNLVNARYDYLGALARLDRAVGTPQ